MPLNLDSKSSVTRQLRAFAIALAVVLANAFALMRALATSGPSANGGMFRAL